MKNLIYYEIVEDCIEAKNVYDAYLNLKLDVKFIEYLSLLGKFVLYQDLEQPLFKVIVRGRYTIKGIQDNDKIRILFPDDAGTEDLVVIKNYINEYSGY